jgi:Septin
MGDAVLDRNLSFVDTGSGEDCNHISEHMALQLPKALRPPTTSNHDLAALLSGAGGSQVDVVLYLLSEGADYPDKIRQFLTNADTLESDILNMKALSELSNVIPLISKADLLSSEQIETLKFEIRTKFDIATLPKLPAFGTSDPQKKTEEISAPYTVSSAIGPDHETMDASLLMSPDYVQPLMPSELVLLVQQIFETEVMSYLRHFAAKKLIAWGANHPQSTQSTQPASPPLSFSPRPSSLASPLHCALSNSGVLVPFTSDLSLTPSSNSQAMIRLAEHAQQEERLAQVRLSQWASDLQSSLQRERERFEKLARGERAIWLVEKMSEEARDGQLSVLDQSGALVKAGTRDEAARSWTSPVKYSTHDPLGLLRWSDSLKTRGWIALQVAGSFGMIGGLAFWLAKTWGLTSAITEWTQGWGLNLNSSNLGLGSNHAEPVLI